MLKIENLSFSYDRSTPVLKNITIEFTHNAIHGIVGNNGEGKTTFFQCVMGLLKNYEGNVYHTKGENIREATGYLSTDLYFYPRITGKEYLKFQQFAKNIVLNENDLKQWNDVFELPLNKFAENYSTGMKKKLCLLSMILQNNKIILLDEPFNGVDMISNMVLKEIFLRLKKNTTIILTSHILESLTNISDDIVYMKSGEIIKKYLPHEYDTIESDIAKNFLQSKINLIDKINF
ncbi:MAG: ATP-binding cassette domain-containing protein [Pseudarcicella sp.]|jgi:ABC-2 type transport system ATP-binding protein|nr:ATP-binding cassette domain-containing protein [Pseudarcicella sp.]MBP6410852.1 ATP-binding cassette domain-containing protein [Pseudarcicella sp.]